MTRSMYREGSGHTGQHTKCGNCGCSIIKQCFDIWSFISKHIIMKWSFGNKMVMVDMVVFPLNMFRPIRARWVVWSYHIGHFDFPGKVVVCFRGCARVYREGELLFIILAWWGKRLNLRAGGLEADCLLGMVTVVWVWLTHWECYKQPTQTGGCVQRPVGDMQLTRTHFRPGQWKMGGPRPGQ